MNTIEYRIWNAFAGVMEPWEDIVKLNKIHLLAEQNPKYPAMQFIGKFDTQGVKIFEGDKVIEYHNDGVSKSEHVVKFDDKWWGWAPFCYLNTRDSRFKVVGHIYKGETK